MERSRIMQGVVAGCIGLALGVLVYLDRRPASPVPAVTSASGPSADVAAPTPTRAGVPAPAPAHTAPGRTPRALPPVEAAYRCTQPKPSCEADPLVAGSAAEVQWMKLFGYPSAAQARELEGLGIAELERRANAGDRIAEVFLGRAMIAAGEHLRGTARISNALFEGSTYAAYAMSEAYGPGNSRVERIDRAAYLRLAYLLGDGKSVNPLARATQGFDDGERMIVDRRALNLYSNLLDERGRSGIPMRVAPRPTGP